MVALVALLHLSHRQVWVEPVQLLRLQVRQQQAVAGVVHDVGPQPPAAQDGLDDPLCGQAGVVSAAARAVPTLRPGVAYGPNSTHTCMIRPPLPECRPYS